MKPPDFSGGFRFIFPVSFPERSDSLGDIVSNVDIIYCSMSRFFRIFT